MASTPLGNALFTATQQKVLGLIFSKPGQSFYLNEIARQTKVGRGGLMRELSRLQSAGIVTVTRKGNQTRYQASPACPIYAELLGIVRKAFGIAEPHPTQADPLYVVGAHPLARSAPSPRRPSSGSWRDVREYPLLQSTDRMRPLDEPTPDDLAP